MRRALAAMALLALVACGDDDTIDGGTPASKSEDVPGNFYEVEINGMPCVVWMEKRGEGQSSWSYSGLDCDWRER